MCYVIHGILLRAIEITYKGPHFGEPQWNYAFGQAWRKKICILEIIYQVHVMKGASHPSFLAQWEHIQIACLSLLYEIEVSAEPETVSASRQALPFHNSMKNCSSSYGYWPVKLSKLSGGICFPLHFTQLAIQNIQGKKYFKGLTNFPRLCGAFFPNHWNLLASYFMAVELGCSFPSSLNTTAGPQGPLSLSKIALWSLLAVNVWMPFGT